MKLVLAGDVMVSGSLQADPARRELEWVASVLRGADATFANFESVVHEYEWPPMSPSGGTWTWTPVSACRELRELGFSMLSLANNHAGDYGWQALRKTAAALSEVGFVCAGAGDDRLRAAQPRYLDTPTGTVGLVAVTTSCPAHAVATDAFGAVPARFGVNVLRHSGSYEVPDDEFRALSRILGELFGVRATEQLRLAGATFRRGSRFHRTDMVDTDSLQQLLGSVVHARDTADVVVASLHSHDREVDPTTAPAYLVDVCHKLVAAGADVVVVHGTHILRPVEFYRGKLICYGLGSLIMQTRESAQPQEAFTSVGIRPGDTDALLDHRRRSFAAGGETCTAALVELTISGGRTTGVRLFPAVTETRPQSPLFGLPYPIIKPGGLESPDKPLTWASVRTTVERLGACAEVTPDLADNLLTLHPITISCAD